MGKDICPICGKAFYHDLDYAEYMETDGETILDSDKYYICHKKCVDELKKL